MAGSMGFGIDDILFLKFLHTGVNSIFCGSGLDRREVFGFFIVHSAVGLCGKVDGADIEEFS